MKPYESVIVYDGTLDEESLSKEQGAVQQFLESNAQFGKADVWGRRELAYEINRKKNGFYVLFEYDGGNTVVADLEKQLKLNPKVLRFLTVERENKRTAKDLPPRDSDKKNRDENAGEEK